MVSSSESESDLEEGYQGGMRMEVEKEVGEREGVKDDDVIVVEKGMG